MGPGIRGGGADSAGGCEHRSLSAATAQSSCLQESVMTPSPVKAAVVQAGSFLFDTPRTLKKLNELTRDAAGRGAQIVVVPEAFVGGYPKGLDFGARIGTQNPERGEDFRRYYNSAIAPVRASTAPIA